MNNFNGWSEKFARTLRKQKVKSANPKSMMLNKISAAHGSVSYPPKIGH
jgi:hypothetical protein